MVYVKQARYFPGQYTKEQQADLDQRNAQLIHRDDPEAVKTEKRAKAQGPFRLHTVTKVTEELIQGYSKDRFSSPLYLDAAYARSTKYGSMIAPPEMFGDANFPMWRHETFEPMTTGNDGGLLEFMKPIRVGDTITMDRDFEEILDTTPKEGSDRREFTFVGGTKFVNQDGELVAYSEGYGRNAMPTTEKADGPAAAIETWGMKVDPQHIYTEDDWEKIYAMWDQETVRGGDTLYWEDVEIGYTPPAYSSHPLTMVDAVYLAMTELNLLEMAGMAKHVLRTQRNNPDQVLTTPDGIKHMRRVEQSINTMGEFPRLFVMMAYGRRIMMNMITNFIGDEGWLRRLNWRNGPMANPIIRQAPGFENAVCDTHICIGDMVIAKAVAVRKYVDNEGNKVDFICWTETFDGSKCTAAEATIILPSKEA